MKVAHQTKMRRMIQSRMHPDQINAYLAECGYSPDQIDEIYLDMNLRRRYLVDCYKMKRNVRYIGAFLMLISIAVASDPRGVGVAVGLLAYGAYMLVTGSMLIYTP